MTTLDERLRTAARNQTEFTPDQHICWQAADRIKQLEAQIEAVKGCVTSHCADLRRTADELEKWQDPMLRPFDATICEIRKAADELEAALESK